MDKKEVIRKVVMIDIVSPACVQEDCCPATITGTDEEMYVMGWDPDGSLCDALEKESLVILETDGHLMCEGGGYYNTEEFLWRLVNEES